MARTAISVRGLSKSYRVFDGQWARLANTLWEGGRRHMREIAALDSVSFEVEAGESVGIIGRNGSGKSTLLQILAGTLEASSGEARVTGRVSALLELGSGFNPEYSGRDNVVLNGLLFGLGKREINRRLDEILAFAEIGDAVERPTKTYSTGMLARLAFAVQVALDPDVLIVDEALSVGDFFFQQKCAAHIRTMQERGVTILFVSHDMGMVRNVCSRAVYLRGGRVAYVGDADRAALLYFQEAGGQAAASAPAMGDTPGEAPAAADKGGFLWQADTLRDAASGPQVVAVDFRNARGEPSLNFRIGERLRVVALVARPQEGFVPALTIKNAIGQVVNVSYFDGEHRSLEGCEHALFLFDLDLAIEAGRYSFQVYLGMPTGPNVGQVHDESPVLGPVSIEWDYERERAPFYGMFGVPAKVSAQVLRS
jgi:lipopolysaccharide transport system ATP-binding protein